MRIFLLMSFALMFALAARAQFFLDAPAGHDGRVIDDVAYHQLMEGYPDGFFYPEKPLARQEALMVITRLCNLALRGFMVMPGQAQPEPDFPDISADHWMRNALEFLAEKGMLGVASGHPLRPWEPVTRGEFLTHLTRVLRSGTAMDAPGAAAYLAENSLLPAAWGDGLEQPLTRIETARLLEETLYYLTQNAETVGEIVSLESDEKGNRWARLETAIGECRLYLPERGVLVEGALPEELRPGMRIRTLSDAVATSSSPSYYRVRAVTVEDAGVRSQEAGDGGRG